MVWLLDFRALTTPTMLAPCTVPQVMPMPGDTLQGVVVELVAVEPVTLILVLQL